MYLIQRFADAVFAGNWCSILLHCLQYDINTYNVHSNSISFFYTKFSIKDETKFHKD